MFLFETSNYSEIYSINIVKCSGNVSSRLCCEFEANASYSQQGFEDIFTGISWKNYRTNLDYQMLHF